MSKTTPIAKVLNLIDSHIGSLENEKLFNNGKSERIQKGLQVWRNMKHQLSELKLIDLEKQTMQDCFDAGREYQYRVNFDKPTPNFETFYSQYNLK